MRFRKKPLVAQYQTTPRTAADEVKPPANIPVEILKFALIPGYIYYRVIKGAVPLARKIYNDLNN